MTKKNKLTLMLALSVGIIFVVIMVQLKQSPEQSGRQNQATTVRILTIKPSVFRAETEGFGQVSPVRSWKAVANVGGRITWQHSALDSGNIISQGARLLQIDPTRYELAEASAQADLAGINAELRQLQQEQQNTQDLLALENQRLALAKKELERNESLVKQGALSQTRFDEQQRATLQQQQAVQSLKNQLNLIPVRHETLQAHKARAESAIQNAREDLNDTHFEAPYDLRVHQVDVEVGQQVNPGQVLFVADDISEAEVTVQMKVGELRKVLAQLTDASLTSLASANQPNIIDFFDSLPLEKLDVGVTPTNMPDVRWSGQLTRVTSSIEPTTRTVQAVITVQEPYRNATPPERPPLVRGTFIKANIATDTAEPVVVIPASALHGDTVYIANDNNQLKRKKVTVAWQQNDQVVVADGLVEGERLILDDVVPAIDGMPLVLKNIAQGESQ
ncbi:efflux RND transporter periplasmic adaptor subunit [Pseudidiomarina salinarum]|uniref:efflux RND transporter periplasmic adaptor subunit n=1 Tax=Pseudidiomarina salinarum TaxID=435908 RepID=UPI00068DBE94|nr:HlyD family efflux transporter periplasmic adaptor subunit [Pseudidiomarina salinarum]RUO71274.1 HlyD family secretion protein [Pseudidiomarina salinarum]